MSNLDAAKSFFEACENGKGWQECSQYATPDAWFNAQAHALDGVTTVQAYTDWMKDFMVTVPDGKYEVKAFAEDAERNAILVYGIFTGTLPASEGTPARGFVADYVYYMAFEGGKIVGMTKVWNDGFA